MFQRLGSIAVFRWNLLKCAQSTIVNPIGVLAAVRRQGSALSIGSALNRFHLKTETESSLRNVAF
jgi:hypothetical protein